MLWRVFLTIFFSYNGVNFSQGETVLIHPQKQQNSTKGARCSCEYETDTLQQVTGNDSYFMYYVEEQLNTQCDLKDVTACYQNEQGNNEVVDFIVVGAGSGGSVVASRLSENREWEIALLEAGGPEPVGAQVPSNYHNFEGPYSGIDWNFSLEPQEKACLNWPDGRCTFARGRVMGGTSVLHGMMYSRGNQWDYDEWGRLGNKGWSFSDVIEYFLRSEDNLDLPASYNPDMNVYHSKGGPLTVSKFNHAPALGLKIIEAAAELGEPTWTVLTDGKQKGFTLAQANTRNGSRLSASKAFLQPAVDRRNLKIFQYAHVTKVLISPTTRTAIGVEFLKDGKRQRIFALREVILCAGALMSPFILLHSGVGPADHLKQFGIPVIKHLPGVGKQLKNHVSYSIPVTLERPWVRALDIDSLEEFISARTGPMTSTGLSQVAGFLRLNKPTPEQKGYFVPDIQFFFGGAMANYSQTGIVGEVFKEREIFTITPTLLRPNMNGEVRLKNKSPLAHPQFIGNYLQDKQDVDLMVKGVRFAEKLLNTSCLRSIGSKLEPFIVQGCESFPFGSDDFWECAIRRDTNTENHWVGTCKMGPEKDRMAVVNSQLQVYGISNLRVIDASIMPTVPSGNVNAPIIMVGEKGAQIIKDAWLINKRSRKKSEFDEILMEIESFKL